MKVVFKKDDKPYAELEFSGSCRKAYLVNRDDKLEIKEAVYILMDRRKHCFYIGQTGDSDCAGFVNRSAVHKWEKKWWEQALVFTDEHGEFQEKLRKWLEGRLNEIAKRANTSLVMSIGKKNPSMADSEGDEILDWILSVCQLCGLPWSYPLVNASESVPVTKCNLKSKKCITRSWPNPTRLSKAIAEKYNGGKSSDYVSQLLRRRTTSQVGTKWREILEVKVGLRFDANGRVIDWREAHNPL